MTEITDQISAAGDHKPKDIATKDILRNFYDSELLEVPEQAKHILETYSHIPPDEVLPHILQVVSPITPLYEHTNKHREIKPGKRY
jgi:hypothetical protein